MESERARTAIQIQNIQNEQKWKEREQELQSQIQSLQNELNQYTEDMEEAKRVIQELQADATTLEEENQDLQLKLQRETMTVENLNSLISLQSTKLSELQRNPQSTKPKSRSKFQSKNNLVQQTIPTILQRSIYKQPSQASIQSTIIPRSLSSSQTLTNRSPKRPLETDDSESESTPTSQSILTNKKVIRNIGLGSSSSTSKSKNVKEEEEDKENIVNPNENSPSPKAHYFEDEGVVEETSNAIIDLSDSISTSLESGIDQTSPVRKQCTESKVRYKEEEVEEEVEDFTSLLCHTTPRPALGDSTNKGTTLKTTNNANLSKDVSNALVARHQHGAGQTCRACDKVN
ncbi:unnamed protein product [Mucor hiemalis]